MIDLLSDTAETYADGSPRGNEGPVPDDMAAEEHSVHDSLVEGIVVADDDLMERYLADETIDVSELGHALATGIDAATVFPVLCGSATKLVGVDRLARFIVEEGPEPHVTGDDGGTALFVFKTIVDPYVGHVNLFKVLQGVLHADDTLVNGRTVHEERLHQVSTIRGKEQEPAKELHAGDIGAVAKLGDTTTGDVLGARGTDISVEPFVVPDPLLRVAIHAKSKQDEDKLATALHRLVDEDPALRVDRNPETHQTLLEGMGETHLAITLERLARKFGVEVETEDVRVPYRETISGEAEAEGKVKKQSGGHGQYAVAWLRVEPLERGEGFEFVDKIVGGVIPRQYIPAVEKGVHETTEHGGVFGYPVVDVRVTCFDGKHHPVDSSEMAFKTAASLGFKDAMAKAGPVLLEPVSELVVVVPESYQGDIMGDLNAKRGRIQGSGTVGNGEVEIVATVPTSEILRYTIDLRSMTGGRGRFRATHSHYDPVPAHLAGEGDGLTLAAVGPPQERRLRRALPSASRSRGSRRCATDRGRRAASGTNEVEGGRVGRAVDHVHLHQVAPGVEQARHERAPELGRGRSRREVRGAEPGDRAVDHHRQVGPRGESERAVDRDERRLRRRLVHEQVAEGPVEDGATAR